MFIQPCWAEGTGEPGEPLYQEIYQGSTGEMHAPPDDFGFQGTVDPDL